MVKLQELRTELAGLRDWTGSADLLLSQIDLLPVMADRCYEVAMPSYEAESSADRIDALRAALSLDSKRLDSWLFMARFDDSEVRREGTTAPREIAPKEERGRLLFAEWCVD